MSTEPETGDNSPSQHVLSWYDRHARSLPWRISPGERRRGIRPDPYRVWLSEIMLQQTTVKTVIGYYRDFVDRWPTIEELAAAPGDQILAAWAGLGYYSRARNLVACAEAIAHHHGGQFPQSSAILIQLPGIGPYTAAAIAAIAFEEPVAVVDGNVERVIARYLGIRDRLPAARNTIRNRLLHLVPGERPGEFAEALMDLGATVCKPRLPLCTLCPLQAGCDARKAGDAPSLPHKAQKKPIPTRFGSAYVAVREDGYILVRTRPEKGLLGGMTEVPGTEWVTDPTETRPQPPAKARWREVVPPVAHTFTHFHLKVRVFVAKLPAGRSAPAGCRWVSCNDIDAEALPTLMRKVIDRGTKRQLTTRP